VIEAYLKRNWTLAEAEEFCREISEHYENFTVGSLLFPRNMRQDLANIYAFCRGSDDLGDEGDTLSAEGRAAAVNRLDEWEEELFLCNEGKPRHPVFIALKGTIERYRMPLEPFRELISAFRQDQYKERYQTFEELLDYCRMSANPVGRIFLMMFGKREERLFNLSDYTCTALQLTNFWQDVNIDLRKGRIYIPMEDMEIYGYSIEDLKERKYNEEFRKLMASEIGRTGDFFSKGAELEKLVDKDLALEIELFRRGGETVLRKIEALKYNVFKKRTVLSKLEKGIIFSRALISSRSRLER